MAIDALLIQTQQGLGFLKRVEGLVKAGCAVRLIAHGNGKWTTSAHEAQPTNVEAPIGRASATTLPLGDPRGSADWDQHPARAAVSDAGCPQC